MSRFPPFVAPQLPSVGAEPTPAPRFPGASAGSGASAPSPATSATRPYTPRTLDRTEPSINLQAQLNIAQAQVDTLRTQSQAHNATLAEERSKFHSAVQVLERSRARACRVLAKDAVALAVEIGHALAGRAFELDQTSITSLLEATLLEFSSEHPVQVRVAPSDVPHIKAHLETHGASVVQVEADPALSPGDLSVEAEQLVVDARLIERVATLREALGATIRSDEVLEDDPSDEPVAAEATP